MGEALVFTCHTSASPASSPASSSSIMATSASESESKGAPRVGAGWDIVAGSNGATDGNRTANRDSALSVAACTEAVTRCRSPPAGNRDGTRGGLPEPDGSALTPPPPSTDTGVGGGDEREDAGTPGVEKHEELGGTDIVRCSSGGMRAGEGKQTGCSRKLPAAARGSGMGSGGAPGGTGVGAAVTWLMLIPP